MHFYAEFGDWETVSMAKMYDIYLGDALKHNFSSFTFLEPTCIVI